jgi:hypothetical protein
MGQLWVGSIYPTMAFDWLLVVALSSLPLWVMELVKAINKRPVQTACL